MIIEQKDRTKPSDFLKNPEPILVWESEEHARQYTKEWQSLLYLDDWIINVEMVDKSAYYNNCFATIERIFELKEARISFYNPCDEAIRCSPIKYCAEKVLIHELLHILFDVPREENPTIEQNEYYILQHQKVEFTARSLMMAKYGISKDWFVK